MAEQERNDNQKEFAIPLNTQIDQEKVIVESQNQEAVQPHTHREHARHGHHHSHHHSHHSRHRSRRKSGTSAKRQDQKKSLRKFMKKYKKHIVYTVLAVIFFVCAVLAGMYVDWLINKNQVQEDVSTGQYTDNTLVIQVPAFEEDVSLIGSAATAYLKGEEGVTVHNIYDRYQGVSNRLDNGAPVELTYELKGAPEGYEVKSTRFTVIEQGSDKPNHVIDTTEVSASFYNLKTGTRYEYRIDITFTNGAKHTVGGAFRTASGPRMMTLDGVYNMRDVGGWTVADGRVVQQGLLYRGCEIDGAVVSDYTITKDGIQTMLQELGVKTDMDLRPASDNPYGIDKLGAGVEHTHYDSRMYEAVFDAKEGRENLRRVFSDLADKSRYPIYMHCTYGQDRTGTVCYLLGGLLGMSPQDLMKDYELTALCHGYVANEGMHAFVERVNQLPGETLAEKVEGYLLTIGVTRQEIQNIREIFLK